MQDIWKTIIEHVLSWPVAVLVLGFTFQKPLRGLKDRVDLVKGPGIELSTPIDSAAKQLKNEGPPNNSELALPIQEQLSLPLSEDIEQRRRAVLTYGGEEEILLIQIGAIEETLKVLHFSLNSEETVHLLIRHLAVTQLLNRAEQLYRIIYGSQIALMRELNESGPQPESVIRLFYERAKAESPTFYGDYAFQDWVKFLVNHKPSHMKMANMGSVFLGGSFLSGW